MTLGVGERRSGIDFRVEMGGTVTVRAVDGAGAPVSVAVDLSPTELDMGNFYTAGDRTVRRLPELTTVAPVGPGDYQLSASASGFEKTTRALRGLVVGEHREIRVTMAPSPATVADAHPENGSDTERAEAREKEETGTIAVTVTVDGKPTTMPVTVAAGPDFVVPTFGFIDAPGGKATFERAAGSARVVAHASGFAPEVSEPIDVVAGEVVQTALSLSRGVAITGEVVDEAGEPVPGVAVFAVHRHFERSYPPMNLTLMDGRTTTGTDGRFTIPHLARGRYALAVRSQGPLAAPVEAVAPATDLVLVLPGVGHTLVGRVTGDGVPLPAVSVFTWGGCPQLSTQTDDTGGYRFENLPSERCAVYANGSGFGFRREVQLGPEEETRVDFQLHGTTVTVRAESGPAPFRGVLLKAGTPHHREVKPAVWEASEVTSAMETLEDGSIPLRFVPPGRYELVVSFGGPFEWSHETIVVGAEPLTVTVPPAVARAEE